MSDIRKTSGASQATNGAGTPRPSQKSTTHSALSVSEEVRRQIERWARSSTLPHRQVQRSRILPALVNGESSSAIARTLGVSRETVRRWHARAAREGVETLLRDRPGRGRRPGRSASAVALVVDCRVAHPSWTLRQIATHVGVSLATVQRVCREHAVAASPEPPSQLRKHEPAGPRVDDGSRLATANARHVFLHV